MWSVTTKFKRLRIVIFLFSFSWCFLLCIWFLLIWIFLGKLFLGQEGEILPGTPAAEGVSEADMKKRET